MRAKQYLKSRVIRARITQDEYDAAAAAAGTQDLSQWVRMLVRGAVMAYRRGHPVQEPEPEPLAERLMPELEQALGGDDPVRAAALAYLIAGGAGKG